MSKAIVTNASVREFASLLAPVPAKEVLSKMARTDQEIEELKRAGHDSGFAEGRGAGYDEGKKAGYAEGHAEGLRQAYEESAAKHQAALDAEMSKLRSDLEAMVSQVHGAVAQWFKNCEPGLSHLAVLIAERVVAKELSTSREAILCIVKEALSEVTHATHATIRLRPVDTEAIQERRAEIMAAASSVKDLEIVSDPSLIGGCMIETDGGVVDALIDSKFQTLLEAIKEAE